ncbi:hypothetical protein HPB48_024570 [Haemaphysalis longicornis]|uniref:Endonuclease/exonuclease/phosphatase domain-containing protein n=1 Tax=Haemaphysalis longicornis TaxID=44386 RepID=A0A9J6H6U3_HAELO|nr:hypothetical protein HPB48_024570 [Haemaphysalis longicornis]
MGTPTDTQKTVGSPRKVSRNHASDDSSTLTLNHQGTEADQRSRTGPICTGDPNILFVGDFNAPHFAGVMITQTALSLKLDGFMRTQRFSLLNDTLEHTRRGKRREQDSNPNLAWYKGQIPASWHNTGQDGGSDHYICSVTFNTRINAARKKIGRETQIIDWEKVRMKMDTYSTSGQIWTSG